MCIYIYIYLFIIPIYIYIYVYLYIDKCKEAAALWQQSPQRMAAGNLVSASCQRLLQQAVHGPARLCLKASWRRPRHQAPGIRRRTASRTLAAHVLPHNPLKSPAQSIVQGPCGQLGGRDPRTIRTIPRTIPCTIPRTIPRSIPRPRHCEAGPEAREIPLEIPRVPLWRSRLRLAAACILYMAGERNIHMYKYIYIYICICV